MTEQPPLLDFRPLPAAAGFVLLGLLRRKTELRFLSFCSLNFLDPVKLDLDLESSSFARDDLDVLDLEVLELFALLYEWFAVCSVDEESATITAD